MTIIKGALASVLYLAGMHVSMAATVGVGVAQLAGTVTVGGWSNQFDFATDSDSVIDQGGGTYSYTGGVSDPSWIFGWEMQANADPFIAGTLSFTNTTATTQTFNVLLSLPIMRLTGVLDETGDVGLTLTDTGGGDNSAALTVNQWHGLINPFPPQLDMPLLLGSAFSCSASGPGCATTLFPPATATQQHDESDHGNNPVDSMGIHLNFDLSAGDKVTFNTRYELTPVTVPLPAAAPLFAAGLMGLVGAARRKKHIAGKQLNS